MAESGGGMAYNPAAALSTVLPRLQYVVAQRKELEDDYERVAREAAEANAEHKRVRANLITTLRVFGNTSTGGEAIRTSSERNEWADSDSDVQRLQLAADLLDEQKRAIKMRWETLDAEMRALNSLLVSERETNKQHARHA